MIKHISPPISVIITVYNCQSYIQRAVDSILEQSINDFELIVVNDGSTDNTGPILEKYNDDRIKIINKKRIGRAKALNT